MTEYRKHLIKQEENDFITRWILIIAVSLFVIDFCVFIK